MAKTSAQKKAAATRKRNAAIKALEAVTDRNPEQNQDLLNLYKSAPTPTDDQTARIAELEAELEAAATVEPSTEGNGNDESGADEVDTETTAHVEVGDGDTGDGLTDGTDESETDSENAESDGTDTESGAGSDGSTDTGTNDDGSGQDSESGASEGKNTDTDMNNDDGNDSDGKEDTRTAAQCRHLDFFTQYVENIKGGNSTMAIASFNNCVKHLLTHSEEEAFEEILGMFKEAKAVLAPNTILQQATTLPAADRAKLEIAGTIFYALVIGKKVRLNLDSARQVLSNDNFVNWVAKKLTKLR